MPYAQISSHLKRAVIASEDDGFVNHEGVDWNAIEKAWERNAKAEAQIAKAQARTPTNRCAPPRFGAAPPSPSNWPRTCCSRATHPGAQGQEFVLTLALEQFLSGRILEIYLNNVEWGNGIFGAEAAARHHFRKSAAQLAPTKPPAWP